MREVAPGRASIKTGRYLLGPSPFGLTTVREFIKATLRPFPITSSQVFDIVSATHEACKNALVHNPHIEEPVLVTCSVDEDSVTVEVTDRGTGFDSSSLPPAAPRLDANVGRGIFIIYSLMDRVETQSCAQGTSVRMEKRYR